MTFHFPRLSFYSIGALAIVWSFCLAELCYGADGHNHNHSTMGPHGGAIVELGDEELHAELLHDDRTGVVTVFMLDSTAKRYRPVEAAELIIQVRHDGGRPEQFRLKAKPQKGERQGQSSRYELKSANLINLLDDHHSESQMGIRIAGRAFVGRINHVHDHDHGDHHSHQH